MSSSWTGSIVSVDCGNVLGVFEGEISNVDDLNQTLSLINVSRNSVKCQVPEVTLSTLDIKDLKLLESTVKKTKHAIAVDDSSFASPTKNGCAPSSPLLLDSQKKKNENSSRKKNGKNPKKWLKERDEACFSESVNSNTFDEDFDFEKNLALFDKKAVFEEISSLCKSDHIRLVDCNKKSQPKYRHDENILNNDMPILRQISVPCRHHSIKEYVTDSGLVVPSVTLEFKNLLYKKAEEAGLLPQVRLEMLGRAATEMVLQLVGGCHRLTPQNTHQRPTVVILCGLHAQGAQAVNCGRQLANHCVNVSLLTPLRPAESEVAREMKLYRLSGGSSLHNVTALPTTVDIILDAMEPHNNSQYPEDREWMQSARGWVKQSKAPVLGLDPPPNYSSPDFKYLLSPLLPFAFKTDSKCSIHVCDVGLPQEVFSSVDGCAYSSPFGSKFVIPLYLRGKS